MLALAELFVCCEICLVQSTVCAAVCPYSVSLDKSSPSPNSYSTKQPILYNLPSTMRENRGEKDVNQELAKRRRKRSSLNLLIS